MYSIKENGRGDFLGGLNTAIIALPLAMAFGVESGLGASAGVVGAIVLGLVASWLGGTPLLISGPTGPMTVVCSLIIAEEIERAPDQATALTTIFIIFLLAGLFQIFFGLLRFGQYIRFTPYPLVTGFMNGIGLMMIIFQLLPLLGQHSSIHLNEIVSSLPGVINDYNGQALFLGVLTIAIIFIVPLFSKRIPSTLIALTGVTLLTYILNFNVPTIGDIPDEWIRWRWSHLISFDHTQWSDVLWPALTLALLGSIDTLLTSVVTDMITGNNHDSNKELIGQGAGNMMAALAGGIPGAGATLRTILNVKSGAKTRVSVIILSVVLLFALFEVGSVIQLIPLSVLAGILITIGFQIIDFKGLREIFLVSTSDGVVMIVVMIATIVFGVIPAFVTGIVLASLLFVKKMADQNIANTDPLVLIPENEDSLAGIEPVYLSREVYIQELNGPLFFGFASRFKVALTGLPHARAVIFRMERVPFVDHSGIMALREVIKHLQKKGLVLLFTGLKPEVADQLKRMKIIPDFISPEMTFDSFAYAADWLEKYLKENPDQRMKKANTKFDLKLNLLKDRQN